MLPVLFKDVVTMHRNDVFQHRLAGGGGYGNALERDTALVLRDVLQERVTVPHARDAYGVVITAIDGVARVDNQATAALRSRMAAE